MDGVDGRLKVLAHLHSRSHFRLLRGGHGLECGLGLGSQIGHRLVDVLQRGLRALPLLGHRLRDRVDRGLKVLPLLHASGNLCLLGRAEGIEGVLGLSSQIGNSGSDVRDGRLR